MDETKREQARVRMRKMRAARNKQGIMQAKVLRADVTRKGANFPTKCPECHMAHERHCSPELIAMFRERMADGRDLIDAETRAVLRAHVR